MTNLIIVPSVISIILYMDTFCTIILQRVCVDCSSLILRLSIGISDGKMIRVIAKCSGKALSV